MSKEKSIKNELVKYKKLPDFFVFEQNVYTMDYYDQKGIHVSYASLDAELRIDVYFKNKEIKNIEIDKLVSTNNGIQYVTKSDITTVINLYGGPSIGKSVLAARLYGEMACRSGVCVEKVNEYAKLLVWQKDFETLKHQPSVTKGQIKHFAPIGQCDYVITDSPIDLGIIYSPEEYKDETKRLIDEFRRHSPHLEINILLKRERKGFQEVGRIHGEDESTQKDNEIRELLDMSGKKYIEVSNTISPVELSKMILQGHE